MQSLGLNSDAPGGWCKLAEIKFELHNWEDDIFIHYKDKFPFHLCLCFRCLDTKSWKSKRRFDETENWLGLDMGIDEKLMRPLTKVEQRLLMGEVFLVFLKQTFINYKTKLEGIKEHGNSFIEDTQIWLIKNLWLKDNDGSLNLKIINEISLEKTMLLFGNPSKKSVFDDKNGIKKQEIAWEINKDTTVFATYYLQEKNWILEKFNV